MARGINNINSVRDIGVRAIGSGPTAGYCCRCDCYSTLSFLLHPVSSRTTFVNFTDFMNDTRIEKNSFGASRLSSVNVSSYPNVARMLKHRRTIIGIGRGKLVFFAHRKDNLPTEVGKCTIGLSHFMCFLTLFDNRSGVVVSIN